MVVWSDECSVERRRGKRNEWVFRTSAQKWDCKMVQIYSINKNMKTIVWASFWDNRRSNLYIIDRDFEYKKYGYSAESYLEVLNAEVGFIFSELDPEYEFI